MIPYNALLIISIALGYIFAYFAIGTGVLIVLSKIHLKVLWEEGTIPFSSFCFGLVLWPIILLTYMICLPIFGSKYLYMKATGLIISNDR
jgi:hypothetical protein